MAVIATMATVVLQVDQMATVVLQVDQMVTAQLPVTAGIFSVIIAT